MHAEKEILKLSEFNNAARNIHKSTFYNAENNNHAILV